MNETTKFRIPENTEFIEQTMENGMLITKFIPKFKFKDCDCYKADFYKNGSYSFVISKGVKKGNEIDYHVLLDPYTDDEFQIAINDWHIDLFNLIPITRQEMQSELAKHGKVFDFENKVLKDLRWIPKDGEKVYLVVFCYGKFIVKSHDYNSGWIKPYENGSLKKTEQLSQDLCDKLNKVLEDNNK